MCYEYDRTKFGKRIQDLRKRRWAEDGKKFYYCKTQETLAEKLCVERRAISGWETGSSSPSLNHLVNLCNALKCNIDYLFGFNDYAEIPQVALASHISNITPDIIKYGLENPDYLDCLNYFMHPNNCSALFNATILTTWKKYIIDTSLSDLSNPLKDVIIDAFNKYYALTSFDNISKNTYAKFLSDAISKTISNSGSNKFKKNLESCLPSDIYNKIYNTEQKIDENHIVSCIADYTYEPLTQRADLELQESKLSKLFIKLFRQYLEET